MSDGMYMEIGWKRRWLPTLDFFLNQILHARIDFKAESVGAGDLAVNIYMAELLRGFVDGTHTERFSAAYVRETDLRLYLDEHLPHSDRELSDVYRHNGDFWWVGGEFTMRAGCRSGASGAWWQAAPMPRGAREERMASFYDQALTFQHRARRGVRSGVTEVLDYILRHPAKYVELMDRVVARLLPLLPFMSGAAIVEELERLMCLPTQFLSDALSNKVIDLHNAQAAGLPTESLEQAVQEIRAVIDARSANRPRSITGNDPPPR